MVSESNIAYTFYVPKNNFVVWEQDWIFHANNTGTHQEDKLKFNLHKCTTEKELDDEGLR
jgi:hypothetical protein